MEAQIAIIIIIFLVVMALVLVQIVKDKAESRGMVEGYNKGVESMQDLDYNFERMSWPVHDKETLSQDEY